MKKIRKLIKIDDVKHASSVRLRVLNDNLSGIEEYQELKNAVKQELKRRKKI